MKPSVLEILRHRLPAPVRAALLISCLGALVTPGAYANPQGGKVIAGDAEIAEVLGKLIVNQGSDRAVIEWESFSISAGEITQFIQPGSNSAALNRVMGASPSVLNGLLKANGNVWLINQNGIMVGPNGLVDVGGFVASTLDVSNDDFLRGGDVMLQGNSQASVQNFGTIRAAGGDIFLVGRNVENHGVLGAFEGTVGLAGGNSVLIKAKGAGNERVFVSAGEGRVTNTGEIASAVAELKAHGNAYALAVNNPGAVRATGISQEGGRILLKAAGDLVSTGELSAINADGTGGKIEISNGAGEIQIGGLLSASGVSAQGGSVLIAGEGVNLLGNAVLEANGTVGGGIEISGMAGRAVSVAEGALVTANGTTGAGGRVEVNGGEIVVYRNSTLGADGETSGGAVALSAPGRVQMDGRLSAQGVSGPGGSISALGTRLTLGSEGSILADGGTAGGSVEILATDKATIDGLVSATGSSGGEISLEAVGRIETAGQILATGSSWKGGRIDVEGNYVDFGTGAIVDASGQLQGGLVNVGGSFQGTADPLLRNSLETRVAEGSTFRADSSLGNAGQVVIWSDGTTGFSGAISAQAFGTVGRGGLIEVSGKQDLIFRGTVTAAAVSGRSGTVLFDPGDVYIGSAASNIPISSLNTILQGKTDVIIATQSGSIFVENLSLIDNRHSAVQWTSDASLGLFASGNISIGNHIRNSGGGSINIIAGWKGEELDFADPPVPVTLDDFGVTDLGLPGPISLGIGSLLASGTTLSTGSLLNGITLSSPTPLAEDTRISQVTTLAANSTIAQGSQLLGGGAFEPILTSPGMSRVEAHWKDYVENKEFGGSGTIFLSGPTLDRHVEVGSRYGNTNVAGDSLIMSASLTNADNRWTQLGFHDSGVVFNPRGGGAGVTGLDLHGEVVLDPTTTRSTNIVRSIRQGQIALIVDPMLIIDTRVPQVLNAQGQAQPAYVAGATTITLIDSGRDNPASSAIRNGDLVTGPGIAPHTYVVDINPTTHVVTLSKATIGNGPSAASPSDSSYQIAFSDPGAVAVATVGRFEVDRLSFAANGTLALNKNFAPNSITAPDADGIADGVMLVNENGPVAGTFMSYANHFNSPTLGNWWWQRIEAAGSPEKTWTVNPSESLGANRPEMGAGLSTTARADINVVLTGRLSMEAGGRRNNAAQIGHGGVGAGVDTGRSEISQVRTIQGTNNNDIDGVNQGLITHTVNGYSINGGHSATVTQSIARLAPIHGQINVITGVDLAKEITYDPTAVRALNAEVVAGVGDVSLRGRQLLTSSAGGSDVAPNAEIEYAYTQIGHLGAGQFGSVRGDIQLLAGGNVTLEAGRQNYAWATVGHTFGGRLNDWNNPSNADAQVRVFSNPTDFDNPNWRVGELFAEPRVDVNGNWLVGIAPARGAFPLNYDPIAGPVSGGSPASTAPPQVQRTAGYWDVNFETTVNQGTWASTTGNSADYTGFQAGSGRSATGPVVDGVSYGIPALMGLTDKTIVGDVSVTSYGENGVSMASGFTPDLGESALTSAFDVAVGNILSIGTRLPAGSVLNGDVQSVDRVLVATTPISATTTILAGGVIGAGSVVSSPGPAVLNLDNKSVNFGRMTHIGHGGLGIPRGEVGGWTTTLAIFGSPTGTTTGSRDVLRVDGQPDTALGAGTPVVVNRHITGVNLIGDVTVLAKRGGVSQNAGNHLYDYSLIGHGGGELADLESSSMAVGDVTVHAQTNVSLRGSSHEYTGTSGTTSQSFAKIGHGGFTDGLYYKAGDISVRAETGDLTMVAGRLQGQYAQIGHSGVNSFGQVGGNVDRNDEFTFTNESRRIDIARGAAMEVISGVPTITLSGGTGGIASVPGGLTLTTYGNTANVDVFVGGDVLMDHEESGLLGFFTYNYVPDPIGAPQGTSAQIGNSGLGAAGTQNAWALIGHGGWNVDQVGGDNDDSYYNRSYRNADKVGNIGVRVLGDLNMRGGDTLYRWSAIGHFANGNGQDRSFFAEADLISGLRLGGTIDVAVAGDLKMDASHAAPRNRNIQAATGLGLPAQNNPVRIGHGGVADIRNYVVVDVDADSSLDMSGIGGVHSDVTVSAGGNLDLIGGRGLVNSIAQIGHGFNSDLINPVRYLGQTVGLSGGIKTVVGGDLTMTGGINMAGSNPAGTLASASSATARIGHSQEARLGDILLSVGNSATFDRTTVGHVSYQNSAIGSNTYLAVSRNQPSFRLGGSGIFWTTTGDIFTSGGSGELRFYMPNRPNNQIAVGTLFNGLSYTDPDVTDPPAVGVAVSVERGDSRGDEYLNYFEHTIAFDPDGIPQASFAPEGPYSAVNGIGGAFGIYYNNSGPGLPVPTPPRPPVPGGSSGVVPFVPVTGIAGASPAASFYKIDVYERQDELVDGSFFTFAQWRDPQGESPYTVDYIGGLGTGSSSVVTLNGFVVPAPLNLQQDAPETPADPAAIGLPLPPSNPAAAADGTAASEFTTETQGSGVQTEMPASDDPFGAPAPAPAAAPAMDDPFGTPPPASGAAPAMDDPFGMAPAMNEN